MNKTYKKIRSLLFISLLLIFVIFFGLIYLITLGLPLQYNSKIHIFLKKKIYKLFLYILNCNINLKNYTDISKKKQKYIIILNHYTALEYFILNVIYPNSFTIVKSDLLVANINSLLKKLLVNLQNTLFKQGMLISYIRGNSKSGMECKEIIKKTIKSHNIIIMPEGTSTRCGIPKNFKKGIFYLAYENKIPIIPLSLKYNRDIGINPGDKINLSNWVDIEANIYVHDEINTEDFNNPDELHNYCFGLITNNL